MKIFFFLLTIISSISVFSQKPYINTDWELINGIAEKDYPFVKSVINGSGNILTISNKYNGNNADIYLQCVSPGGDLLWTSNCLSSITADDWASDIVVTNSGEVIITGTFYNGSNYDYLIEKYSGSGGLIWRKIFNSGSNDIATAITLDSLNNVFVTGTSNSAVGFKDFTTLKLDSFDGSVNWLRNFDFSGKEDIATDIIINNTGEVIVTGSSAESLYNSQFTLIKYNSTSGNLIDMVRHDSPGVGYDIPTKIIQNDLGNYFIIGISNENIVNSDIKVLALDNAFGYNWTRYYDHSGSTDKVIDAILNGTDDLIVTGFVTNTIGGTDLLVKSYSSSGLENWMRNVSCIDQSDKACGYDLNIDTDNNIIVAGTINRNGFDEFRTACYDNSGRLIWSKNFNLDSTDCIGSQVVINGVDVCVIGTKFIEENGEFLYVNYEKKIKSLAYETDSLTGKATFRKHELFVAVHPDSIFFNEINNQKSEFWKLEEIFKPGFVSLFQNSLTDLCGSSTCDITVYKVFQNLRTTDTVTTSRLGEIEKIPDFWATFLFEFSPYMNVDTISSRLDSLFPQVSYNHKNPIIEKLSVPNDNYFNSNQLSLTEAYDPSVTSDAHIDIQNAWDFETGKSFVKCGVFDTELYWQHEDFGDGTIDGSQIKGGWTFSAIDRGRSIFVGSDLDADTHGTNVAGIIGAIRNNDLGVSGIAGGNYDDAEGVSLYGLTIFNSDGFIFTDSYEGIVDAIVSACINGDEENNYGIHVANHSWGSYATGPPGPNKIVLQTRAFKFSNRLKVTNVAGRGNTTSLTSFLPFYPAVLHDDWIITVTQTGTDGNWKDGIGLIGYDESGYLSHQGGNIDLGAPGVRSMIYTTSNESSSSYSNFENTSAATPHVSGVVSLLMSYHNNPIDSYENLSPEDCEEILRYSCTDIDVPGYDDKTGYGRLNAKKALELILAPNCQLRHHGTDVTPSSKWTTLQNENKRIHLEEDYQNAYGEWFREGWYWTNVYKISGIIPHPTGLAGYNIEGIWPRHSSSTLLPEFNEYNALLPREKVSISSFSETNCSMNGYIYEVLDNDGDRIGWWPFDLDLSQAEMCYTLLRCNEDLIALNTEKNDIGLNISLYPNPSNDIQTIKFYSEESQEFTLELYDRTGSLIHKNHNFITSTGYNSYNLSLEGLAKGMYFIKVIIGDKTNFIKTIKD